MNASFHDGAYPVFHVAGNLSACLSRQIKRLDLGNYGIKRKLQIVSSIKFVEKNIMRIIILMLAHFALLACAAPKEAIQPAPQTGIEAFGMQGGTTMRKPVQWDKSVEIRPQFSRKNKKLETREMEKEKFRGGGRSYLLFQKNPDKKTNTNFVKDTQKSYQKTDTNYNARKLNKGEYRNTYDPRNISEYRQYIRHNWSNSSRRPFDVYRPGLGNVFRQLK